MRHAFPGNVRELQNIIEHAFVLSHSDRIGVGCLPGKVTEGAAGGEGPDGEHIESPLLEAEAAAIQ
jgi:DNA-binding NtrC family response regulator